MTFKTLSLAILGYLVQYKGVLAKALAVPAILITLLDLVEVEEPGWLAAVAYTVLAVVLQTLLAVTTHRVILLGADSVPPWGQFAFSRRELVFAGYILLLDLIIILASFTAILHISAAVLALLLCFYALMRVSLIFPSIAVDRRITLEQSWDLTQENKLLMFQAVFIIPAILFAPLIALSFVPYTVLVTSLLSTLIIIVTIAALSVSYRHIIDETDPRPAPVSLD